MGLRTVVFLSIGADRVAHLSYWIFVFSHIGVGALCCFFYYHVVKDLNWFFNKTTMIVGRSSFLLKDMHLVSEKPKVYTMRKVLSLHAAIGIEGMISHAVKRFWKKTGASTEGAESLVDKSAQVGVDEQMKEL